MFRWASSKPWLWAWVVAELLSPSALPHPCHQSQISHTVQMRSGTTSPRCRGWQGWGPLSHAHIVHQASSPTPTPRTSLPLLPRQGVGPALLHPHHHWDPRVVACGPAQRSTQISTLPQMGPDQGDPHGLWRQHGPSIWTKILVAEGRSMEPDTAFSGSMGPDITMASGGSEGLTHQAISPILCLFIVHKPLRISSSPIPPPHICSS